MANFKFYPKRIFKKKIVNPSHHLQGYWRSLGVLCTGGSIHITPCFSITPKPAPWDNWIHLKSFLSSFISKQLQTAYSSTCKITCRPSLNVSTVLDPSLPFLILSPFPWIGFPWFLFRKLCPNPGGFCIVVSWSSQHFQVNRMSDVTHMFEKRKIERPKWRNLLETHAQVSWNLISALSRPSVDYTLLVTAELSATERPGLDSKLVVH